MPARMGSSRSAPFIPNLLEDLSIDTDVRTEDVLRDIPILSDRSGWDMWLQRVETVARLGGIWEYVNPRGARQLQEPVRPEPPVPPAFDTFAGRRRNESDQDFQARFLEHKLTLDLAGRSFAISQDRFRVDCLEYSIKLGEHATAKEELNQLNVTIYSSVADEWKSHLAGDKATTPRLKLVTLESLMTGVKPDSSQQNPPHPQFERPGSSQQNPPHSQFERLIEKLKCEGPRDWLAWASDVIDLSEGCDEIAGSTICDQLAKDSFLESVEPYYADFHERWSKKVNDAICYGEAPVAFHEIIDEFISGKLLPPAKTDTMLVRMKSKSVESPPSSSRSTDTAKLTSKWCPGCQGVHRIKGSFWWQTCWVYHEYMGGKTAPRWFKTRTDKLEAVRDRMLMHPKEEELALEWYLSRSR
ncbi:hypothetical protein HRG_002701 [Hirsutella rhossiliensis]|uniref:Uncharacterized protein n=1 Tax=Hirsutella rhossiliensis TaxID=111463 RepID=A0A9P8N5E7_9HYPO|nr:uncharacterized protein HRG_02701 [Hirsutella rhossiliensis]KAH0967292.1 hypothetical protein HRG_02701 [Hirsutella rhossiliensis]